ncbi:MAG: flagellar export protein FliJ [Desulfovermiculus sp.]
MRRFPLLSVLGYRKNAEDMAQLALTRARQEYQSLKDHKQAEEKRLLDVRQEFEAQQARGMTCMTMLLYQQCLESIAREVHKIDADIARAGQKVEDKKQALHKACTDKKMLEKLNERHDHRMRLEDNRMETLQLDDVAVFGWGRGGS